jgi:hypothetical protein
VRTERLREGAVQLIQLARQRVHIPHDGFGVFQHVGYELVSLLSGLEGKKESVTFLQVGNSPVAFIRLVRDGKVQTGNRTGDFKLEDSVSPP